MDQAPKSPSNRFENKARTMLELYQDPALTTLYRYENTDTPYDESREGVVSRKEMIGDWFTDNVKDLGTYIKMRQPGGRIVMVRMPKEGLENYDAANIEATKEMDREAGNYIIPKDLQSCSRLEMLLVVETKNGKKFQFNEWGKVDNFLDSNLKPETLAELASKSQE